MDEMDRLFRQSDFSAENEELEKRIWNRIKRYNEEGKIMPINKNELTKEMIAKAMQCKTVDELMALAKAEGFDITKDEAEAYFAELADVELDEKALKSVAGGSNACWNCLDNCGDGCPCRD
jgi:predicted ribosomally synthesized peptide with nif11-like leader